jgi:Ca2+-binding RTX toxin-like protein
MNLTNFGTLSGNVVSADKDDTFTDFKKIGHKIKSGIVVGVINLGDGADHFNGGANGETVHDGAGDDTYKFGGGNDTYLALGSSVDGTDIVDGGKGIDTYDAGSFSVSINLDTKAHDLTPISPGAGLVAAGTATGTGVDFDHITGFENVIGSGQGDLIYGSAAANILDGKSGDDNLLGFGGNDTLIGGTGTDGWVAVPAGTF